MFKISGESDPKDIFLEQDGTRLRFLIWPEERDPMIRKFIDICGGIVASPFDRDVNVIKILDMQYFFERSQRPNGLPEDVFTRNFLEESYFKNSRQDLDQFRFVEDVKFGGRNPKPGTDGVLVGAVYGYTQTSRVVDDY